MWRKISQKLAGGLRSLLCYLKFFVFEYNELWLVPIGFILWYYSDDILHLFDATAGTYDSGIFQIPLFVVISFSLLLGYVWVTIKLNFPFIWKYYQNTFQKDFETITPYQRICVSLSLLFAFLLVVALLARVI
jgi:hypothetical protein